MMKQLLVYILEWYFDGKMLFAVDICTVTNWLGQFPLSWEICRSCTICKITWSLFISLICIAKWPLPNCCAMWNLGWQCNICYVGSALCRELNDNQLAGHIPPELGKLTELFDLYVSFPGGFLYVVLSIYKALIQHFAGMLLITTLKDLFPIILAHVQISTACKHWYSDLISVLNLNNLKVVTYWLICWQ